MKKISLYTRQHQNSRYELERKGIITNKEFYIKLHMMDISDFFIEKYRRFIAMAEKRLPRPEHADYPIWCSVSKNNCLKPTGESLVYCLEVPKDEVIYFSGIKWDLVLNNLYIPKDYADACDYQEQIKNLGVTDQYNFLDGKYKGMYPEIEKKIIDSWERIFEIDEWNEFKVQANLWHIKKEWIKHIVREKEDFFAITKDMHETFPPKLPS